MNIATAVFKQFGDITPNNLLALVWFSSYITTCRQEVIMF